MGFDETGQELPRGWIKPQRKLTLPELLVAIEQKRAELDELERQAEQLQLEQRLWAIAQARNIMRAHQLTLAEVLG